MCPPRESDRGEAITIVAHDIGGPGGMERQLEALIVRLLAHGATMHVYSRTLDVPPHPSLRWRRIPGPARPFVVSYPWFAIVASLRLTRRSRGVLQTTGAIIFNRADVCTVHYVHNGPSRAVRRGSRPTPFHRMNAVVGAAMSRVAERMIYSRTALSRILVAVSDPLVAELTSAFPSRAASIHVIENGVDSERFRPDHGLRLQTRKELGIDNDVLLALFVGSEWGRKGVDVAIEALAAAPSWHLAVVGRGDADAARRSADALGVADRLHLVGERSQPERYYAAADAFVLPTTYEAFPLAALEAAASALPIVATDVGALGEIVNPGGGIFVERTAGSLAAALRQLEANPEAARAMSQRAREIAERFSWDAVATKYLDLYGARARLTSPATTSAVAG
jgi:UDP-glucose:(heptosyl)LPS alpha-1,3-glucosyltransferase